MSDGIVSVWMQESGRHLMVYLRVYYFEEHNEPVFGSPCLQRFPVEVVKH